MQQIIEVINLQSKELYQNVSELLRVLDHVDDLKFGEQFLALSDQILGKLISLINVI